MKDLIRLSGQYSCWLLFFLAWPITADAAQKVGKASSAPAVPSLSNPLDAASLGQFAMGLVVVVGVILLLAWMLRRMNRIQGRIQGHVRILAGLPLGSRERVVLLQVGQEQVLLGVAPGRVSRLLVLEQPLETGVGEAGEKDDFRKRLMAAIQRRRSQ